MTRITAIPALVILGAACIAQSATVDYQNQVLTTLPILYYQFNAEDGNEINHGTSGSAFDLKYFGSVDRGAATSSGDVGVSFDGGDDYLESIDPSPASLTGNPSFSAEAVVFVPTTGGAANWAPFLHWGPSNSSPTMRSVYFSFSNDDPEEFYAGFYNGGLQTQNDFPRGEWYHVVWVRDGGGAANAGSTLYVNGQSVAIENDPNLPSNGLTPIVGSTEFRVNRARDFDGSRFFTGILDELALYDRPLTPAEVRDNFVKLGFGFLLGDMDGNGVVDAFDVDDFEQALADKAAYIASHPGLDPDLIGDLDRDGELNAFDVTGFEQLLAGVEANAVVPEPTSVSVLIAGMTLGIAYRRQRDNRHPIKG